MSDLDLDSISDLDLDAIEARANAATPGPWSADYSYIWSQALPSMPNVVTPFVHTEDEAPRLLINVVDAAFIAEARTDVPALVAEVRRLQCEVERLAKAGFERTVEETLPERHLKPVKETLPRLVREIEVLEKAAIKAYEEAGRPIVIELPAKGTEERRQWIARMKELVAKPPAPGSCVVVPERDTVAYHRAVCFARMTHGQFLATEGGQRFFAFMPGSYLVEFGPGTRWCVQFGEHTAYGTRVPDRWLPEFEATMRRHPDPAEEAS